MRCLLHVGIFLNCTWCELLVKFLFLLIPHVIEECNGLSSRCKVGSRAPEDEPCPGGGWWLEWFIYGYIPGKGAFQEQKHRQTSENFGRSPPAPPQKHVFYEPDLRTVLWHPWDCMLATHCLKQATLCRAAILPDTWRRKVPLFLHCFWC